MKKGKRKKLLRVKKAGRCKREKGRKTESGKGKIFVKASGGGRGR